MISHHIHLDFRIDSHQHPFLRIILLHLHLFLHIHLFLHHFLHLHLRISMLWGLKLGVPLKGTSHDVPRKYYMADLSSLP